MVGMEGVEPPRLAALGSKPSVSTSSTTSPGLCIIYSYILLVKNILCFKDCNLIDFFLVDEPYKVIRII